MCDYFAKEKKKVAKVTFFLYNNCCLNCWVMKMKMLKEFKNYNEFFSKNLSEKTLIEKYAVTGGVPKYIESFTEGVNIYNEIQKICLNINSISNYTKNRCLNKFKNKWIEIMAL